MTQHNHNFFLPGFARNLNDLSLTVTLPALGSFDIPAFGDFENYARLQTDALLRDVSIDTPVYEKSAVDFADSLNFSAQGITLTGTGGVDTLTGTADDDTLIGLGDADVLDGGGGTDLADYSAFASGVLVRL